MACGNKPAQAVRRPVELLGEAGPFRKLGARRDLGKEGAQKTCSSVLPSAGCEDSLAGTRWNRARRGNVRSRQMTGALEFLGQPCGQWGRLPDLPQRPVHPGGCTRPRGNDVAAVRTDINLPGESPLPGSGGALPLTAVGGPIPNVHAARRGPYTQGRVVFGGRGLAAESRQHGQGVKARPQATQIDSVPDRDSRKEPVTGRQFTCVRIDVDDDQVRGPAGNTDTQSGGAGPPVLNAGVVQGRGMETVTPAAALQARAVGVSVTRFGTISAVGGGRLATRSKRVNGPAVTGAPPSQSQTSDGALRGRPP